ncbi:MAG: transporter substrate-binding domain-containing protein [Mogibacterium sp.]|nr:transporter substrate-binding domain-containing protein [Mogibacterium sp.]
MKTKKIIALLLVAVLAISAVTLAGCSKKKDENAALIVGMECTYPPFCAKEDDGTPSGLEVDLIKDFGTYIGREIQVVDTAWDGLIPGLKNDSLDMVISSMTITEERQKEVDFSNPYCRMVMEVLVYKDSPVQTFDELNNENVKIACKQGTVAQYFAQSAWPKAQLEILDDPSVVLTECAQGKVDAAIYDEMSIYEFWKEHQDTTRVIPITKEQNAANDYEGYIGVAFKKGNDELRQQFNDFIKQYDKDGGFDKLTKKYFAEEEAKYKEMGFVWFFDIDFQSFE